jgi:ribonuclease-3
MSDLHNGYLGMNWEKSPLHSRSGKRIQVRGSRAGHSMDNDRRESLQVFLRKLGRTRVSTEALERYHQALTHRSYCREKGSGEGDNERLEFLGDRILNFVVAEYLYSTFAGTEGELTIRMEFTKNRNLAFLVAKSGNGLEELILTGKGQEKTPRIIAGSFEAFIAAFYLDAGLERTKKLIFRFFPEDITDFGISRNHKKVLQEYLQKKGLPTPHYELECREGADHQPQFVYVVRVEGNVVGRGSGRNKTEATQNAAQNALKTICRQLPEDRRNT